MKFSCFVFVCFCFVSHVFANDIFSYKIKGGDSLHSIANENKISVMEILRLNKDLQYDKPLFVGQEIKLKKKSKTEKESAKKTTKGTEYTVVAGDTLFAIAQRIGVPTKELAEYNNVKPESIYIGQKILIPVGEAVVEKKEEKKTEVKIVSEKKVKTTEDKQEKTELKKVEDKVEPVIVKKEKSFKSIFSWPVNGKIIAQYGVKKSNGQTNDGVNIEVHENTNIRAADSGNVVFIGDAIKDFGYLMIIQHPDGFLTTYGNLNKVVVDNKTKVQKGQIIAQSGKLGSTPQLYFSISKDGIYYNPSRMIKETI